MNNDLEYLKVPYRVDFRRIAWQLGILIIVSIIAVLAEIEFNNSFNFSLPEQRYLASTFNKKQSGLSAVKELCDTLGIETGPWESSYRKLGTIHGTLVIIEPKQSFAEFDIDRILDWVSKGNDLLYIDEFRFPWSKTFLKHLKIKTRHDRPTDFLLDLQSSTLEDPTKNTKMLPLSPLFSHVPFLRIPGGARFIGGDSLLEQEKDGAVLIHVTHGKGNIIIGSMPEMFANRLIQERKNWPNFQFLLNCLRSMKIPIWFDERCHGYTSAGNVFVLLAHGVWGLVIMQCTLILIVTVLSATQRFGPVKISAVTRKIANTEFVIGLANTYRRAHANVVVLEIIGQSLRNSLCKELGISPRESTENIVECIQRSGGSIKLHQSELVALLQKYDKALSTKQISDNELKSFVRTCDKITFDETGSSINELRPTA